jgi:[ribosomal protein S18]-alanine N-acetyltransferase
LIRLATSADVPSIIYLERTCASAAHWTEQQYRQTFDSGPAERLALVAEAPFDSAAGGLIVPGAGGNILGFLVALHLAPEWELENIVVAPSSRRQGLGQQLLQALLATARETDSESVFLEVRDSNALARGLYEKTGFAQTGRRRSYYKDPAEDAVRYRLTLK